MENRLMAIGLLLLEAKKRLEEKMKKKDEVESATAKGEGALDESEMRTNKEAKRRAQERKAERGGEKKSSRVPNQPGTGRVTAQGQAIEKETGFKQKRFGGTSHKKKSKKMSK